MTQSIVFDENRLCTDFSFNAIGEPPFFVNNPTQTKWLTDPNATRDALQSLRIMKSRETGDDPIVVDIDGRDIGNVIDFTKISYENYKMRRKCEVLKYKTVSKNPKKIDYAYFSKSGKSKYKSNTNERIKQLIANSKCNNLDRVVNPATNSGVFGDSTPLYFDSNVPFYDTI